MLIINHVLIRWNICDVIRLLYGTIVVPNIINIVRLFLCFDHVHDRYMLHNLNRPCCLAGLGSSTVDQVHQVPQIYTKYKYWSSTHFFKKYLSTSSTFISSTSTHIKICSKVSMDIQSRVNFGWTK